MKHQLRSAVCTEGRRMAGARALWVANGMHEVDGEMPFKDVPQDSYYAKAVAWAYANDITAGKSADSFAPDDPCTRGQIMTFLYNAYAE